MKKLNLIALLLFVSAWAMAQVDITQELPASGDTLVEQGLQGFTTSMLPTASDTAWDYSTLSYATLSVSRKTFVFKDTSSYPNPAHSNAQICLEQVGINTNQCNGYSYAMGLTHWATDPTTTSPRIHTTGSISLTMNISNNYTYPMGESGIISSSYQTQGVLITPNGNSYNNAILVKEVDAGSVNSPFQGLIHYKSDYYKWYVTGMPMPVMTVRVEYDMSGSTPIPGNPYAYFYDEYITVNTKKIATPTLDITLFPNPTNSLINISTTETVESMQLLNQVGQVIRSIPATATTLSVEDLTNGIYILEINTPKGVGYKQFVKQ